MGTAKKTVLVIVLLLVVETLYLDDNPLSFGLPFRSVQYGSDDFPGHTLSATEIGFLTVFRVDLVLLVCDLVVAALIILLLVASVPAAALVPLVQGCVLGCVAGALVFGLEDVLPEPWLSLAVVLILLVIVPFTVYALSLGHKHQKTVIIIVACATLPTCIRAGLITEGLLDGIIDEMHFSIRAVIGLAGLIGLVICLCFVLMVLHKKVLPAIWRKKRIILPAAVAHSEIPQIANSPEQTDTRSSIRRVLLYTSLLAITVYVGWHFMTLREMRREDSFTVSDAISAEFERLKVPLRGAYSFTSPRGGSELLKPGWNVSFQVEILVNHKDTYCAEVKKNILIPWIQVKIHKKESGPQTKAQ
jgi:hypothetical protein